MNNNKLDTVSIMLIKGLISTSICFYKAQLKARAIDEEIAELFMGVCPHLELADALEMDIDFIQLNIVAVLKGKITEDECAERIIKDYEEFYINRILEKERLLESINKDIIEYVNQEGIDIKKEMEAMIVFLTDNNWGVNVAFKDSIYCIEDLCQYGFKTKEAAMNHIEHLRQTYNIKTVVS